MTLGEYNYFKIEKASFAREAVLSIIWDRTDSRTPIITAIKWQLIVLISYIVLLILVLIFAFRDYKLSLNDLISKTSLISRGNLQERVLIVGNNEFTTLSEQFNDMVSNLEHSQNALINQKEEISAQKDEIKAQRDLVSEQNKEITDSINYAKRIQSAVLPSDAFIAEMLPEHFVLFKPRDIVSGDFYWIKQIKNFTIVVAADCTGHGVPGAFMSMLGVSMLNEIIGKSRLDSAGEFLDRLRKKVKSTLSQEGKDQEQKDGMDMSLAIFDSDSNEMQYAGAFNPIYIIRKKEESDEIELSEFLSKENETHQLFEIKGDRQPISIYSSEKEFKTNYLNLKHKDNLYMFSDGYPDQMGGPKGKKFMVKKFKELLLSIQDEPMNIQQEILDNTLNDWKQKVKQIDDILVIGIRWK